MFDVIPRRQVSYIGALTPSPTPHGQHKYYYAAYRLNHLFNCFYVGIILVCSKIFKHVLKPCVPSQLLLHTDAYFYISLATSLQLCLWLTLASSNDPTSVVSIKHSGIMSLYFITQSFYIKECINSTFKHILHICLCCRLYD